MKLSFVIPAYNERATLPKLVEEILHYGEGHDAQIVLIDDGSTDDSHAVMKSIAEEHEEVEVIAFPSNRGKTIALAEGLKRVTGEIVFTLDGDLQDDPKEIPDFLAKLDEGWDMVCGWKAIRHDPWHKTLPSRVYNGVVAAVFDVTLHDVNCGYKAMRREVADSLDLYGDRHRLVPILAVHAGFRVTEIAVEHQPRRHGKSKYGIERFVKGAADVMSLWFTTHFSESPGHFFTGGAAAAIAVGVFFALISGAFGGGAITMLCLAIAAGSIGGGIAWLGLGFVAEWLLSQQHAARDMSERGDSDSS